MANHTILLIDYEPRSIERFRQPLVAAGYAVEIATDGISGVEAFTRLNPDMVLVEAMIPKKHGFEVCQELKRTPHGRRTPIIITTGVYKGRKYRTQALHIYGCDEYIEKPIAAEQLLAIVERFLGSSSAASREPVSAAVDVSDSDESAPADAVRIATEPAPARPAPPKQNTIPKAVVADLTEDEIMARLDAILPGATQPAVDPVPARLHEIAPPVQESDPFGQMQAELSAELGSLSAALALEPAPILEPMPEQILEPIPETMSSDQVAAPSLLETLPEPGAPEPPPSPGQVVNFDVKRSRKNKSKKGGRKSEAPHAETIEPVAPAAARRATARADEAHVPSGSLVESALETSRPSRGIPAWVWIALGAAVLVVVYFLFLRGDAPAERVERREAPAPRVAAPPKPAPPVAVEPAVAETVPPTAPDTKLLLNSVDQRPAKATPPPQTPKIATKLPVTQAAPPIAKKPPAAVKTPAVVEHPQVAPPAGGDESAAGVEAIANPIAPVAQPPAIAAGTLVDIAEADVEPVSLSRKLPTYSMQARQMRLQGTIVMKVLVNERGSVDQVVLFNGVDGADLNESAMKAARQWTYRPASKGGVPVKVWKTEQVTFKL